MLKVTLLSLCFSIFSIGVSAQKIGLDTLAQLPSELKEISGIELVIAVIVIQTILINKIIDIGWVMIFLFNCNPPIALIEVDRSKRPKKPSAGKLRARLFSTIKSEVFIESGALRIIK